LRALGPFRSLRTFHPLDAVGSIHLRGAGIVAPFTAAFTGNLIGTIETSDFSSGIEATILTTVLLAILLPHIARLRDPHVVTAPSTAAVASPGSTIGGTWPAVI
jgi:hypothetical protein